MMVWFALVAIVVFAVLAALLFAAGVHYSMQGYREAQSIGRACFWGSGIVAVIAAAMSVALHFWLRSFNWEWVF